MNSHLLLSITKCMPNLFGVFKKCYMMDLDDPRRLPREERLGPGDSTFCSVSFPIQST